MTWVKSPHCNHNACVEVSKAFADGVEVILVRDSHGGLCRYSAKEWDAFLAGMTRGIFNRGNL